MFISPLALAFPKLTPTGSWNNGVKDPSLLGSSPVSILTYTPWGYVSANLMAGESDAKTIPIKVGWPPKSNDSDTDWALVGRSALAYTGPFRLNESVPANETQGQIIHGPLTVVSVPSMLGTTITRDYKVYNREDGIYLHLSGRFGTFTAEAWWRKL